MKSVERLIPWLVIAIGIVFLGSGSWGVFSGIVLLVAAIGYLLKNNRKSEFKIICFIIGAIIVIMIGFVVINLSFTKNGTTTTTISN